MSSDHEEGGDQLSPADVSEKRVLVKHPNVKLRKGTNKMPVSKGRPVGSVNKTTAIVKQLVGESAEKIIKKVIKKALTDDDKDQGAMLKLLLERIMPATKAIDINSTHKTEQSITISIEGMDVHNAMIGNEVEAEIVDFIEDKQDD